MYGSGVRYKRILLKLSGEALAWGSDFGFAPDVVANIAQQIKKVIETDVQVAIVVGGGNIWRGVTAESQGMDRATADYAGMIATIINALVLQDALEKVGVVTRTQSAITVQAVAEPYIQRRAIRHLEKGRAVLFAAGTGNPHMTTDTAAALRSVEIGADVLLMAKNNIDGVYSSNPQKDAQAVKFEKLTYMEAIRKRLQVMDSTALSLCMDNNVPIIVFDLLAPQSIERVVMGEQLGTLVHDVS